MLLLGASFVRGSGREDAGFMARPPKDPLERTEAREDQKVPRENSERTVLKVLLYPDGEMGVYSEEAYAKAKENENYTPWVLKIVYPNRKEKMLAIADLLHGNFTDEAGEARDAEDD